MKTNTLDLIDFEKVDTLLEGFSKSTGFVTAILDLEGNVLSKSGWRQMCTEFHRVNPETSKKCTISDTELANKMGESEKYHFNRCLNGLVDVAVPIIINGEHIANLFSGQFFFEEPDISFFKKQAKKYGFDESNYLDALSKVPIVSQEKVKTAMDFLLAMTLLISDLAFQKAKQFELNKQIIEAKEKAEESEAKLNALFTSMAEMVVLHELVFDGDGKPVNYRITDCNHAFTKITGIKRKNAIGRLSTEVYGTEEPPYLKEYSEVALTGEPQHYETYFPPMGKHFSISVISPEKNHFATVTTDITEIKQTEEALRESEENLSITLHSIGDGVITTDKSGMIDRMNPVALKLCGWQADEIIGKPLTEVFNIISADTREPVPNPVEKVIKNGEIVGLANHTVLVAKDGREYQIADSAAPIKDKDGNIKGVVLVFSDVSEKYAAEEERRKSDERFRIAQEMSPDGFTILHPVRDAQNRVIDFTWIYENDAIARLNGTDPQKVVGQLLLELFPGHRDTQFFKAYQQVAESEESITFEEGYAVESMQKQTWFRIVVVPMGENIAVLAQDITDRKMAERNLIQNQFYLKKAQEIGSIGTWEIDLIKNELFWTEQNYINFGVPLGTPLSYETFLECIHPDDKDYVNAEWMAAINGKTYDIEHRLIVGGEIKWVREKADVEFDDSKKAIKAIGFAQDITYRRKAEEALIAKMDELERFHKLTVGREITMVELKKEVNNLLKRIGKDPKYKIVE